MAAASAPPPTELSSGLDVGSRNTCSNHISLGSEQFTSIATDEAKVCCPDASSGNSGCGESEEEFVVKGVVVANVSGPPIRSICATSCAVNSNDGVCGAVVAAVGANPRGCARSDPDGGSVVFTNECGTGVNKLSCFSSYLH